MNTAKDFSLVGTWKSHLSGCICLFAQIFWEGGRDLRMMFCYSSSTVWVINTLIGGGDAWTLTAIQEFEHFEKLCGDAKILLSHPDAPSLPKELSLPNISHVAFPLVNVENCVKV